MNGLTIYFIVYGILAVAHILYQMILGHLEFGKQKSDAFRDYYVGKHPSVTVVVPCYNESPGLLMKCLHSIQRQNYPGKMDVIIVDDGSKNIEALMPVYQQFKKLNNFQVIFAKENRGKREAQKLAFDKSSAKILVTIDSDTQINFDGIEEIVKYFRDDSVGAVTGDIKVENRRQNFLTRLISYRYWMAFHQERAAQSLFDVVMCCSGPFSAYRRSVVEKVKEAYVSQKFLGKKCTFGDDRHLTNLILDQGYQVRFDNLAIAYTNVPENIRSYLKQQVRWNKSFYREMLWTLKGKNKHWYMMYDLFAQLTLPFMLIFALGATTYQALFVSANLIWVYILVLMSIGLLRSLYGLIRTRDVGFLSFVCYGFLHVTLLIPTRIYALLTLGRLGWGTR